MQKQISGTFMKKSEVIDYIEQEAYKWTLSDIIQKTCEVHVTLSGLYYSTKDLRNIITPKIFRELETKVNTHICFS
jgi:hypothetical protein